jgi:hypothetical protein
VALKSKSPPRRKLAGMKLIRCGKFLTGSDILYPEEAPARLAAVGDFWIDEHPVTNRLSLHRSALRRARRRHSFARDGALAALPRLSRLGLAKVCS